MLRAMAFLCLLACRGELEAGVEASRTDPAGAISRWEAVRASGAASSALLYNLGCLYQRQGDLPGAIAAWREAWEIDPRDADIAHNLALARGELKGAPDPVGPAAAWMEIVTPSELGFLGAMLLALGSGAALLRKPASRRDPAYAVSLASIVVGGWLSVAAAHGFAEAERHPVAVLRRVGSLRTDALTDAEIAFSLPAGTEVSVRVERSGLLGVEAGDGRQGWVAREALILVSP